VPLGIECRNVIVRDGFDTAATFGSEEGQVVRSTVRLRVLLMKSVLTELLSAMRTEEVLGVPVEFQGRHAFLRSNNKERVMMELVGSKVLDVKRVRESRTSKIGPLQ